MPTTRVPAVMADRSEDATENVPPVPPTEMDLAPLGLSVTVLPPVALTEPENVTSLAVINILQLPQVRLVDPALVTLPVPSVVIVRLPPLAVVSAFRVTLPFDPEEVCSTTDAPKRALDAVMVPLALKVRVAVEEVTEPEVPMVAEAPVVVTEKLPAIDDPPRVTAPALVISAVPVDVLLAVNVVAAV